MKNENLNLGKKLAKYVHKKYGVITYSGTLAIEIALVSLNLAPNSNILISSEVCFSIINTIKKINLNPILVNPKDGMVLTEEDIDNVLTKVEISCIMLVHQYGIFNKINKKKYQDKNIKIIEDIAQSWICDNDSYRVGINSDIVVTSFGKTKPLSYGIGGALFFDEKAYLVNFDFCDKKTRLNSNIVYSYVYPKTCEIKLRELLKVGKENLKKQRKTAKMYRQILKNNNRIKTIEEKDSAWHRFPIYFLNKRDFINFITYAKEIKLEYQLKHKKRLAELPLLESTIEYGNKKTYDYVLLRTRNIDYQSQKNNFKDIINKLVKKR